MLLPTYVPLSFPCLHVKILQQFSVSTVIIIIIITTQAHFFDIGAGGGATES
jgi:hypothetical protein